MVGITQGRWRFGTGRSGSSISPTMADLLAAADTDQVHVLRALLQMSYAVLCAHYFDEALEAIADHSLTALNAASVSISRWERQENVLRTLINVGDLGPDEQRWPENELYPVDSNRDVIRLLQQGLPYTNSVDDTDHAPEHLATLRQVGKESEIAVPVMYEDKMWGELWATGVQGRRFGPDDVQVLQAIAAHTAVAIGRSELFSAVWSQAFEDPLTGLANRRRLDQIFDDMDIQDVRPAVLLCDLDFFKEVNDRLGHAAGDALLCIVADALTESAAQTSGSAVARLGGDEFCVILPGGTTPAAERFARAAGQFIGRYAGDDVSLSWGVAVYEPRIARGDELVGLADRALLDAKRLGPGRLSTGRIGPTDVPPAHHRRRPVPPAGNERVFELVPKVLALLDQVGPTDTVAALEVLCLEVCHAIDAVAYSISVTTDDGTGIYSLRGVRSLRQGASGLRVLAPSRGTVYLLSDYPVTERAIATGEPFIAAADLDGSDSAEVSLLEQFGYRAVLGVPVADGRSHYLVEIYSDTGHDGVSVAAPYARVLAHYCTAAHA